jgi:hypothetical protein
MASTPTFQSNPYGSFDPSQWSNPYSNYYGQKLPWPASYAGTPTNAQGQAIQPPPGMTLNSTPAQPQQAAGAPAGGLTAADFAQGSAMNPSGNMALAAANWGGFPASGVNTSTPGGYMQAMMANPVNQALNGGQAGAAGAAGAAGGGAAAPANNWQQTLAMLANPGHVTTPGATVPAAPSTGGQPTPGVLQNFLANWQPASSGAGSGFTQNFNTILRGLQSKGS